MDSAGECCLHLLLNLRETEGEVGSPEASPGSPRAQVSCNRMGCWRHVFRRIGVTQRCLDENSATRCPVPLGSPAWHSVLQGPGACHGGVGTGLPRPLQRSSSSFSTCGRLQWVSASEMAYFSTVFKTEATVTAQAREADKDQHFFIWCFILSQTCAWWGRGLDLQPKCPGVRLGELWSCSGGMQGGPCCRS